VADAAPAPLRLRPLRRLLPFVAPYRRQVALALLFLLLAAGATLALPYAVRLLVDQGLTSAASSSPFATTSACCSPSRWRSASSRLRASSWSAGSATA
jgi:ABC-type multidrug transport system fused ATPase/permease subunit